MVGNSGLSVLNIGGIMLKHQGETNVLLKLMRVALQQERNYSMELDPECDKEKLEEMIQRQSLVSMLYPIIEQQTEDSWNILKKHLKQIYDREIHRGLVQEYEMGILLSDMEKDGIDCLPLKGWVLRKIYPDPIMRSMGDLDVLIKDMDSRRMQKWMEEHGYIPLHVEKGFHDEYKKPPYMYVELHHSLLDKEHLFRSEIEWLEKKEKTFWREKTLVEGKKHIYQLTDENFYVHHMSHFYKHFTGSGAGVRFLADTFLLLKYKEQGLDWNYVDRQLEALHILAFSKQMNRISKICFSGKELDEKAELVAQYLTDASVYGSMEMRETLQILGRGDGTFDRNKSLSFLRRCFPSLQSMQDQYHCLYRYPWLTPIFWGIRIVRIVFREQYKLKWMIHHQTREEYNALKKVYCAADIIEKI